MYRGDTFDYVTIQIKELSICAKVILNILLLQNNNSVTALEN